MIVVVVVVRQLKIVRIFWPKRSLTRQLKVKCWCVINYNKTNNNTEVTTTTAATTIITPSWFTLLAQNTTRCWPSGRVREREKEKPGHVRASISDSKSELEFRERWEFLLLFCGFTRHSKRGLLFFYRRSFCCVSVHAISWVSVFDFRFFFLDFFFGCVRWWWWWLLRCKLNFMFTLCVLNPSLLFSLSLSLSPCLFIYLSHVLQFLKSAFTIFCWFLALLLFHELFVCLFLLFLLLL